MEFIGEHIWIGLAGKISIWAAFFLALFSMLSYGIACNQKLKNYRMWRFYGRSAFRLHTLTLLVSLALLLHMIWYHYYEYRYVWQYSANELGSGYLLSALWAGQEGSFLLWAFFQGLIGVIVLKRARNWEMPVMTVISFAQLFLIVALSGFKLGSLTIGNSPFILLREMPENIGSAFFASADYLSSITDGLGLNPLLMNFWMKIHPPILFLGFAALIVPFAFALASLMRKDYTGWLKPVLPWVSFSACFLGAGLLLGGVWAYEDLTFGGFWAWDSVENSSLVPWMFTIAALHLILISKRKGSSLSLTYSVVFLSYILVLYSSFLTRSGILSSTSVHAFAGSGMSASILIYLIVLVLVSFVFLFLNIKKFPKSGNDPFFSQEFWMFLGVLAVLLAAFQILFSTSLPVINKLFNLNLTLSGSGAESIKNYYNNWQLPFTVILLFTAAIAQFLLIGKTPVRYFIKKILFTFFLSIAISYFIIFFSDLHEFKIIILVFAAVFVSVSVLDCIFMYDFRFANKSAMISHFGLGIFILGIVLAFYNNFVVSRSDYSSVSSKRFDNKMYIYLQKDKIYKADPYYLSYSEHSEKIDKRFYQVDFLKKNGEGQYYKVFSLTPSILLNNTMGNVYIPDTRHYPVKDIFTYIAYAEKTEFDAENEYELLKEFNIKINDTVKTNNFTIVLNKLKLNLQKEEVSEKNASITAQLNIITPDSNVYQANPIYQVNNSIVKHIDAFLDSTAYKIRFEKIAQTPKTIVCGIYGIKSDYIIIKTIIFPYIILVWIGAMLVLAGFIISFIRRKKNAYHDKKDIGIIN